MSLNKIRSFSRRRPLRVREELVVVSRTPQCNYLRLRYKASSCSRELAAPDPGKVLVFRDIKAARDKYRRPR